MDWGNTTAARLAWIWLVDDRDEPSAVDVVVEDAGQRVFDETYPHGTEPSSEPPPVRTG